MIKGKCVERPIYIMTRMAMIWEHNYFRDQPDDMIITVKGTIQTDEPLFSK